MAKPRCDSNGTCVLTDASGAYIWSDLDASEVCIAADGTNRYRVFTSFVGADGDHLCIVAKRDVDRWVFSDEGHYHMWYDDGVDAAILAKYGVEDRDGELLVGIENGRVNVTLQLFVNAMREIVGAA